MQEIKIAVQQKHFKEATSFLDNHNCPLAQALKDAFPDKKIVVWGYDLSIGNDNYNIPQNWILAANQRTGVRHLGYFDTLIAKAKAGEEVETFDLVLTKN